MSQVTGVKVQSFRLSHLVAAFLLINFVATLSLKSSLSFIAVRVSEIFNQIFVVTTSINPKKVS